MRTMRQNRHPCRFSQRQSASRHPARFTAFAVVLALGLGACGGSDEDDVKSLAKQVASSDEKVCDHVTADFLKTLGGSKKKCRDSAKQDTGTTKPKVEDVKVDGDKATAALSDGKTKATLRFAKDGGDWKVDGVR